LGQSAKENILSKEGLSGREVREKLIMRNSVLVNYTLMQITLK
jgi:hypothetical protein